MAMSRYSSSGAFFTNSGSIHSYVRTRLYGTHHSGKKSISRLYHSKNPVIFEYGMKVSSVTGIIVDGMNRRNLYTSFRTVLESTNLPKKRRPRNDRGVTLVTPLS